jgi:predicted HD superfamily hydrolase involved in NAD metabolism
MKTYEELLPIVRERLNGQGGDHRFRHTLGVVDTALRLAKLYGADLEKTRIAALLHDATKYDDSQLQRERIARHFGEETAQSWPKQLLHGFSAVVFAKEECGIDDEEILLAIQNHSVGRPGMGLLEKIIFAADYLEPGRGFYSRDILILAETNLDKAIAKIIRFSLDHVEKMGYEIVPLSLDTKAYFDQFLEDNE